MTKHDAFNAIGYGLGVIQLERVRQVDKHGFDPEHDRQYEQDELLAYAVYWLLPERFSKERNAFRAALQSNGLDGWGDEWFKYSERTPEERLARAGALIAAEIDRLRATPPPPAPAA